jgi:hypothetical protein
LGYVSSAFFYLFEHAAGSVLGTVGQSIDAVDEHLPGFKTTLDSIIGTQPMWGPEANALLRAATYGSISLSGLKIAPPVLRQLPATFVLESQLYSTAQDLMAVGALKEGQQTLGFALDTVTGRFAFALNSPAAVSLEQIHPALRDLTERYSSLVAGERWVPRFGPPGTLHGEVNAMNKLLQEIDQTGGALTEADFNRFSPGSVWLGNGGPFLMSRCPKCWFMTPNVNWQGPSLKP